MTPDRNQLALDADMPADELRLHMGELTSEEIRVARAAIRWANSAITAQPVTDGEVGHVIARLRRGKVNNGTTIVYAADIETLIRAATATKNCEYAELKAMNDRLVDDCVKAKKECDALVKALERIRDIDIADPVRYVQRADSIACEALAAHRAQEGK